MYVEQLDGLGFSLSKTFKKITKAVKKVAKVIPGAALVVPTKGTLKSGAQGLATGAMVAAGTQVIPGVSQSLPGNTAESGFNLNDFVSKATAVIKENKAAIDAARAALKEPEYAPDGDDNIVDTSAAPVQASMFGNIPPIVAVGGVIAVTLLALSAKKRK